MKILVFRKKKYAYEIIGKKYNNDRHIYIMQSDGTFKRISKKNLEKINLYLEKEIEV